MYVSEHTTDDNYLASLSDLMIGLLFVFIIILMGFALNYRLAEQETAKVTTAQKMEQERLIAETQAQRLERLRLEAETLAQRQEKQRLEEVVKRLTNNDSTRRALLKDMQSLLKKRGLRVLIDEKNGILRLPEALLFDSGEARFRPEGEQAMRQLATVLMDILPCYSFAPAALTEHCEHTADARLEAVLIEGHTDNKPIQTSEFKDNWSLASSRARNTYKALSTAAPALEQLQNPQQQALLSVSAYASRRPVAEQNTDTGRRKNRRIDLRFLMAAPPPAMVENARQQVDGIQPEALP